MLWYLDHPEIREEVANKNEQLAGFLKGMIVNPERMGQVSNISLETVSVLFVLCASGVVVRGGGQLPTLNCGLPESCWKILFLSENCCPKVQNLWLKTPILQSLGPKLKF